MSLTPDDVRRLAHLARIDVAAGETDAVLEGLNRVLGLVEEIRRIDTKGIEPMSHAVDPHVPNGQRLRPDQAKEPDRRDAYQAVAPAVQEGLYLVPKVIE